MIRNSQTGVLKKSRSHKSVLVGIDTLFADSAVGGVEWHVRVPKRIHLPEIPNPLDGANTDVKVCSASISVYAWQAPICSTSVGAAIASCSAASVSGEPTSSGICGGSIASASLSCGVSLASMFGMIRSCFGF